MWFADFYVCIYMDRYTLLLWYCCSNRSFDTLWNKHLFSEVHIAAGHPPNAIYHGLYSEPLKSHQELMSNPSYLFQWRESQTDFEWRTGTAEACQHFFLPDMKTVVGIPASVWELWIETTGEEISVSLIILLEYTGLWTNFYTEVSGIAWRRSQCRLCAWIFLDTAG